MFRRFVPLNTVSVVGAQIALASTKSKNKAKVPEVGSSDIKAANRRKALAVLNSDSPRSQSKQRKSNSPRGKKTNHDFSSQSFANSDSVADKAYSKSMGLKGDKKKSKDTSGDQFDAMYKKVSAKADKKNGHSLESGKAVKGPGAASLTAPQVSPNKDPVSVANHESNKMDFEGAAQHPATAAQMAAEEDIESNYEIQKKAEQRGDDNTAAATSNKDTSNADHHDYNAHNLPPTPLQEVASVISSVAGRIFSMGSNSKGSDEAAKGAASQTAPQVSPDKDEAAVANYESNKMDFEGAAQHPATAAQMAAEEDIESNYEIQKKAEQRGDSSRISSSSGESQQAFLKSYSNASRMTESPSYGNYSYHQSSGNEAYATASTSDQDRSNSNINKTSNSDQSASPLQGISSTISNFAGRLFTKESSSDATSEPQMQSTSVISGPPTHTHFEDANILLGDAANNSGNKNASAPTDYSSPDYLVRRT